MTHIDWSKAPKGATHWEPEGELFESSFMRKKGGVWECFWRNGWVDAAIDDRDGRPKRFVPRPAEAAEWGGDGLPPVGTVCEMKRASIPWWEEVEILCHGNRRVFFRGKDGNEESRLYRQVEFRTLRTPEQIAAEEREKAIEQMMEDYKYKEGPCTHHLMRSQAERIYDAGYRKVEGGDA